MNEVEIVYFIEHAAREMDTACAVKYLLQSRYNVHTEIQSIVLDLDHTLTQFLPRIVVLPYCVSIKSLNLEKIVCKWPDARYINLSYEQLLGDAQKQFKAPADDFARNYVIHHAWGVFFDKFLIESGVPEQNIVVNGNPSYALYRDPYQTYYGNVRGDLGSKFDLDLGKRWVFIPENYGWAFFENHMLRDRIKRGFDADQAYIYRDFSVDSLRTAAEWWCEGAQLDGIELVIRPRPAVPKDIFTEKIQKFVGVLPEKLHIIKYGSVREWILASDVVFSSYSTTLLEAATAKKTLYMLVPYPFPEFIHVDWNDLADKVNTKSEFLKILSSPTLYQNWKPLENWVFKTMLSHGDPIANLAEILASMLSGEIQVQAPSVSLHAFQSGPWEKSLRAIRKFGWRTMQRSLYHLGIKTQAQRWNPHEMDRVSQEDVANRVAAWKEVLN